MLHEFNETRLLLLCDRHQSNATPHFIVIFSLLYQGFLSRFTSPLQRFILVCQIVNLMFELSKFFI